MAYFPPYFDGSGLHLPAFADVNQYLFDQYTAIYGQSVSANISTTDVQAIAIFSMMTYDCYLLAQAVWNGMSPMSAVGVQQDSLYKINGIARLPATSSTATLTVTGIAGTVLNNCVAADANGNLWDLPTSVTIPTTGSIDVPGVCETTGQITAGPGTITVRVTGVTGWNGVTNAAAATPGTAVETDSAFRARQSLSVAGSSVTPVDATLAAIAAVPGVTRWASGPCIENPTGATDSCGNPPHSISMVVEGGTDAAVAQAIYTKKTPGCLTNGTTTVNVTDPITGSTMPISFFRPIYVPIFADCTVVHLAGYTTATDTAIQTAIVNYLNSLQIGEELTISALYGAALSVMPNLSQPMFSITAMKAGTSSGSLGTVDIPITFKQVCQGLAANVSVHT